MAIRKRARTVSDMPRIPQTLEEAGHLVLKIQHILAELNEKERLANSSIENLSSRIKEIKKNLLEDTKDQREHLQLLADLVMSFAQAHRDRLIEEAGKKTIDLDTGDKLRWYLSKRFISFEDEQKAIDELKAKGILEGVRVIEEVNKNFLLGAPEIVQTLETISIEQPEIFAIVLSRLKIELESQEGVFKKVVYDSPKRKKKKT